MPTVKAITPGARHPEYQVSGTDQGTCLLALTRAMQKDGVTDYRGPFLVDFEILNDGGVRETLTDLSGR